MASLQTSKNKTIQQYNQRLCLIQLNRDNQRLGFCLKTFTTTALFEQCHPRTTQTFSPIRVADVCRRRDENAFGQCSVFVV